ncbi:apolipoprotein N-acyltransferase [uncultured Capnocytophaga sp.]|uniref:apolipoprotein N-acyltransferase n=1 Tax=uncultured Capnocytophaga sp. TaxID=159273 RepID=UPI0025997815|nr:apolipoprotein N-acyltransferase [uncultured Capnocytophaga sp.]
MKKNFFLALLSGGLLAASWVTYGITPLIFIAFVPLLLADSHIRSHYKHTKRKISILSYIAFLIWNIVSTWWIWNSTQVGAVLAISINSLLMTLTFLLYHLVAKRSTQKLSLIFLVAIWLSFEKFHLWWDISWPWLNLGNVFSEKITWIQWYEYTGAFGGSLWVWLLNIIFYIAAKDYLTDKNRALLAKRVGIAMLFFAIPVAISYYSYINYSEKGLKTADVVVLQPNIDPYEEKYQVNNEVTSEAISYFLLDKLDHKVNFIITPETMFARNILIDELANSAPVNTLKNLFLAFPQVNWVVGVSLLKFIEDKKDVTAQSNYLAEKDIWYNDYNSAFLLNYDYFRSDTLPLYHKSKLVVAVENFPYQHLLKPILGDMLINLGGTVALKTTQSERSVFTGRETFGKAAPIICYETVYGEFVTDYIKKGANFLAILTNDAWWGDTQGYKQLLSYTRLRAIETRRSVARSANTGISAFINGRGDILKALPYRDFNTLRCTIALNEEVTFYVRMGDYIARIAGFLAFFIFLYAIAKKRGEITFQKTNK